MAKISIALKLDDRIQACIFVNFSCKEKWLD
jgi:hypothetical protein